MLRQFELNRPEKRAVLWKRSPIVKTLNDGLSLHYSIGQIIKLYPERRHAALLSLMATDFIGGSAGALIGRHAIMHPNRPMTDTVRMWEAATDGAVAFIFTLREEAGVYVTIHPEDGAISNEAFWNKFMPAPMAFFFSYTLWHSLPDDLKEQCFPANTCLGHVRVAIDYTLRFAFYNQIFQIFLQSFLRMPSDLPYQFVSCVPALLTTTITHPSSGYKERADCIMVYISAMNLCYFFGEELNRMLSSNSEDDIGVSVDYSRLAFWLILSIYSIYFTIKNTARFTEEYQENPQLVAVNANNQLEQNRIQLVDVNVNANNQLEQGPAHQLVGINVNNQLEQRNHSEDQSSIERLINLRNTLGTQNTPVSVNQNDREDQRQPLLLSYPNHSGSTENYRSNDSQINPTSVGSNAFEPQ